VFINKEIVYENKKSVKFGLPVVGKYNEKNEICEIVLSVYDLNAKNILAYFCYDITGKIAEKLKLENPTIQIFNSKSIDDFIHNLDKFSYGDLVFF